MCVCPKYVKNNKLDFDPFIDRFYNYVPCGKCYECQESKRNDYEVRSIFEYIHSKKIGGCTYFFTLTYDDGHLPKLPGTDIKVGSIDDIQRFIKRLRKNFKTLDINFKYFIVSEYGSKTFRPHYHGFIYLDKFVDKSNFHKYLNKSWDLGFTCFGENGGLVLDVRAFHYVSKYVCKDFIFTHYLNSLDYPEITKYMSNTVEFRKKFTLPNFHLSSQNFGLSILNYLSDKDYIKGYFVSNDIVGLNRKLTIPLYILRYGLYDKYKNSNGSISYRLSDYGKKIFVKKMKFNFEKYTKDIKDLFRLSKNYDVYCSCPSITNKLNFSAYCEFVDNLLNNEGVEHIVSYKLLYHDIDYVPFSFKDFYEDLQIFVDSVFDKSFFTFNCFKKFECPFSDDIKIELEFIQDIKNYFKYLLYCQKVDDYNRQQYHKKLKTKEIKLKYKCTFSEFINSIPNFKKYRLCLNTSQNTHEAYLSHLDDVCPQYFELM